MRFARHTLKVVRQPLRRVYDQVDNREVLFVLVGELRRRETSADARDRASLLKGVPEQAEMRPERPAVVLGWRHKQESHDRLCVG